MIITPHEYSTVRLGLESGSSYRSIESSTIRGHPKYIYIYTYIYIYIYIYIQYIRGGTVHVFVLNRHGTGISVRCMMPYDGNSPPIQKGAPAAMQRCLITASRRTANANGDTEAAALMFGSLYFILIKYQLAVKIAMLELMCVCVCVCVCVRRDHFNCFLIPALSESALSKLKLL